MPLALLPLDNPKHPINGSSFGFHLSLFTPCLPQILLNKLEYAPSPGNGPGSSGWELASMLGRLTVNNIAMITNAGEAGRMVCLPDFSPKRFPDWRNGETVTLCCCRLINHDELVPFNSTCAGRNAAPLEIVATKADLGLHVKIDEANTINSACSPNHKEDPTEWWCC